MEYQGIWEGGGGGDWRSRMIEGVIGLPSWGVEGAMYNGRGRWVVVDRGIGRSIRQI